MKHKLLSLAVAATLATLSAGAWAQNAAIVNGKAVPSSRVDALAKQFERSGRPVTPELREQIKQEVVMREVFVQAAQGQGLDKSENYRNQLDLARQAILIQELFAQYAQKNPVTDAQAKAEYDKFVSANGGKEYHARHILVEKEDEAKSIIAQLKGGANFEELAKKLSKDPGSGANGGDLDWASPDTYVPEFSEALIKLDKGQLTETPIKTQFGYHVIRLDDVRKAELPEFDKVKPQIIQQLQQQKLQAYQNELRSKAKIQ
jgi:peptidyl-prolyl cis-trans isomerase C